MNSGYILKLEPHNLPRVYIWAVGGKKEKKNLMMNVMLLFCATEKMKFLLTKIRKSLDGPGIR